MGFLTFIGIASAIAYGLATESKSANYKARKSGFLQRVNYDVDVERDFADICHVCGVRKDDSHTKLFGISCNDYPAVWPKNGWKQCIPFLKEQPRLTDEDIDLFVSIYIHERRKTLDALQECYDEFYVKYHLSIFREADVPDSLTIFLHCYWSDISVEQHRKMADDIYYNTFWHEIATGPAKIIENGFCKRREIWQVKDYERIKDLYSGCVKKCGYDDMFL